MLLDKENCDINLKGFRGRTVLIICCDIGYPLHKEIFAYLLEMEADINVANDMLETAFIVACKFQRFDMATQLLDKGSSVNHQGINKNTALINACFDERIAIVDYLLQNKADINLRNINGDTAFSICCYYGHLGLASVFLERGFDINVKNMNGRTCLMIAIMVGSKKTFSYLLEQGADPNSADEWGYTALMFCSKDKNWVPEISVLLAFGAKISVKDRNGDSCLHQACKKQNLEAIDFLLGAGANPYDKNLDDEIPFDLLEDQNQRVAYMQRYIEGYVIPSVESVVSIIDV